MTLHRILAVLTTLMWVTALSSLTDVHTAQAAYTITDLGTLGGNDSFAYGVNASGQVAGSSFKNGSFDHAFLYSGGTMHDLGVLPGTNTSSAASINAGGQVVGR